MADTEDEFENYVEHPRFGRGPRYTERVPKASLIVEFFNRLWFKFQKEIPGTGIVADPSKQTTSSVWKPYYFDRKAVCMACKRPFLFFAEEQRFWYEELGFNLAVQCARCVECRKKVQLVRKAQQRYEKLITQIGRSPIDQMELIECYLVLIEEGVMHQRRYQDVRKYLKTIKIGDVSDDKLTDAWERVRSIEESPS